MKPEASQPEVKTWKMFETQKWELDCDITACYEAEQHGMSMFWMAIVHLATSSFILFTVIVREKIEVV